MPHFLPEAGRFRPSSPFLSDVSLSPFRGVRGFRGFTLVELMTTVAIAIILTLIAVPTFHRQIVSHRLNVVSGAWSEAFAVARMAAIRGNTAAQVCSSATNGTDALGQACPTGVAGVVQWAGNQPVIVRAPLVGLDEHLRLSGTPVALRFDGNGVAHALGQSAPYTGLVLDVCSTEVSVDNHRQVSLAAGTLLTSSVSNGGCS